DSLIQMRQLLRDLVGDLSGATAAIHAPRERARQRQPDDDDRHGDEEGQRNVDCLGRDGVPAELCPAEGWYDDRLLAVGSLNSYLARGRRRWCRIRTGLSSGSLGSGLGALGVYLLVNGVPDRFPEIAGGGLHILAARRRILPAGGGSRRRGLNGQA